MNANILQLINKLLPEGGFTSSGVAKVTDKTLQSFVQDIKAYFANALGSKS